MPDIPEEAVERKCPTCGSAVRVAGDPVEGTMHYEPAGALYLTEEEKRALLGVTKTTTSFVSGRLGRNLTEEFRSARQKLEESLNG